MTAEYDDWTALDVRRPGDVPAFTPLTWLLEKETEHSHRLSNNVLPADFPHPVERGTAADALAALALREAVRRQVDQERAMRIREALTLGATWTQLATALDVTPDEARALLREWAEAQHRLHQGDVAEGRPRPFGLDDEAHAAVLALCERSDNETAAAVAGATS